jgi:hypothetical protein
VKTQHHASIEEMDDETHEATCQCGWEDGGYEDREDADHAAEEHLRETA